MAEPCNKCQSQDVKWVEFTSKAGNAVKGWKCQEKACGNLMFAPRGKASGNASNAKIGASGQGVSTSKGLETKVDRILAILEKNFGKTVIAKDEEETEVPF